MVDLPSAHVAGFIARVRTAYELAVWTSAKENYADLVVRSVFPVDLALAFLWSRERCTWRHHHGTREEYWLKNLRKVARLGCDLDRVLMVDDESHKLEKNHGNHIPIAPFTGAGDDTELPPAGPLPPERVHPPQSPRHRETPLAERFERINFLMDKRAEFFGQCRVAPVVECSRLAAPPMREIPRSLREGIITGRASLSG